LTKSIWSGQAGRQQRTGENHRDHSAGGPERHWVDWPPSFHRDHALGVLDRNTALHASPTGGDDGVIMITMITNILNQRPVTGLNFSDDFDMAWQVHQLR
jgi:hypothetical protein